MNLPFFKRRVVPVLAICVIALLLAVLPRLDALFFDKARYAQCSALVAHDPAAALAFARTWRKSHPASPLSWHCEAVALFAARDYANAATMFLALGTEVAATNPSLATRLFVQGAQAYKAAKQPNSAKQAAASALLLEPGNAEAKVLLTELARENFSIGAPGNKR